MYVSYEKRVVIATAKWRRHLIWLVSMYSNTPQRISFVLLNFLRQFKGIAFVGGFSYSDTFSSGYAWYHTLKSNKTVMTYLKDFYHYKNSFSLGVCNGCQLMSHLEWIPKCKVIKNDSNKFEKSFL